MSAILREAVARFNDYAALQSPHLPSDPVRAAQVRAFRWGVANFGCELEERYVLGLIEEYAELIDADEDDLPKELGDVLVCAAQLCTCYRLNFETLLSGAPMQPLDLAERTMLRGIGQIARAVLKGAQGTRGMGDAGDRRSVVGYGVYQVCIAANGMSKNPGLVFAERVHEIVKRDYKANPIDGGR